MALSFSMHILVTGSSGTIGTRLCEKLLEAGHTVTGVDREDQVWHPHIAELTIKADLRDENSTDLLPGDIDAIIHLAANARVYELVENPDRARDNMMSTFNVLDFARKNGIKKFIFASSRECYGNVTAETLTEDMVKLELCESPYTASKIAGEALVHSYAACYGIEPVIVRFSNVYGMYDNSIRVVPLFIRRAEKNEPLFVFGEQKNLDFTYIDDAVQGVERILERYDDVIGETFNLAYGEGHSIVELATQIRDLKNSESEIELSESRTGEILHYVADISKAKELLGFEPQIPFEEGVKRAVEWYAEHT